MLLLSSRGRLSIGAYASRLQQYRCSLNPQVHLHHRCIQPFISCDASGCSVKSSAIHHRSPSSNISISISPSIFNANALRFFASTKRSSSNVDVLASGSKSSTKAKSKTSIPEDLRPPLLKTDIFDARDDEVEIQRAMTARTSAANIMVKDYKELSELLLRKCMLSDLRSFFHPMVKVKVDTYAVRSNLTEYFKVMRSHYTPSSIQYLNHLFEVFTSESFAVNQGNIFPLTFPHNEHKQLLKAKTEYAMLLLESKKRKLKAEMFELLVEEKIELDREGGADVTAGAKEKLGDDSSRSSNSILNSNSSNSISSSSNGFVDISALSADVRADYFRKLDAYRSEAIDLADRLVESVPPSLYKSILDLTRILVLEDSKITKNDFLQIYISKSKSHCIMFEPINVFLETMRPGQRYRAVNGTDTMYEEQRVKLYLRLKNHVKQVRDIVSKDVTHAASLKPIAPSATSMGLGSGDDATSAVSMASGNLVDSLTEPASSDEMRINNSSNSDSNSNSNSSSTDSTHSNKNDIGPGVVDNESIDATALFDESLDMDSKAKRYFGKLHVLKKHYKCKRKMLGELELRTSLETIFNFDDVSKAKKASLFKIGVIVEPAEHTTAENMFHSASIIGIQGGGSDKPSEITYTLKLSDGSTRAGVLAKDVRLCPLRVTSAGGEIVLMDSVDFLKGKSSKNKILIRHLHPSVTAAQLKLSLGRIATVSQIWLFRDEDMEVDKRSAASIAAEQLKSARKYEGEVPSLGILKSLPANDGHMGDEVMIMDDEDNDADVPALAEYQILEQGELSNDLSTSTSTSTASDVYDEYGRKMPSSSRSPPLSFATSVPSSSTSFSSSFVSKSSASAPTSISSSLSSVSASVSALPPIHPVSSFAGISPKTKKRAVPVKVVHTNHAFVRFKDVKSYDKFCDPDVKLFGLTIQKSIAKVSESEKIQTIIVEVGKLLTAGEIKDIIHDIIGQYFTVDLRIDRETPSDIASSSSTDDKSKYGDKGKNFMKYSKFTDRSLLERPVFAHLDFDCHESAWTAYYLLSHAHSTSQIMKPLWAQTMLYMNVVDKNKEIMLKQKFFAGF